MFNQVHVEGFVTKKIWQRGGDTFFRLAVYRDPDRPRKAAARGKADERDKLDYVTIRVPAPLTTLPVAFHSGQLVQVHGWLESREFDYTLAEFLKEAEGPKLVVSPHQATQATTHRGTTWIVADRILNLPADLGRARRQVAAAAHHPTTL